MLWANRNGFWHVLDRATGEFLQGKPFVRVNWAEGIDAKGVPEARAERDARRHARVSQQSGRDELVLAVLQSAHRLFYIPTWMDTYSTYTKGPVEYKEGNQYVGRFPTMTVPRAADGPGAVNQRTPQEGYGAIQAFDPKSGELKWQFKMADVTDSGVLTTATDLLFAGGREGYFFALDARSGELLWKGNVRRAGIGRTDVVCRQRHGSMSRSRQAARCSSTVCASK